jgi:HPt (histidine-containing phosphotransfer) domain-containing protein
MENFSSATDLDLSFLYEIADGSNEFIVESIEMFLQHAPEMLQDLGNAIDRADWPVAAAVSHKLKPNLGFFGMLNSQGIMQEIELECKAGAPDTLTLKAKYNGVKDTITANFGALATIKKQKEAEL